MTNRSFRTRKLLSRAIRKDDGGDTRIQLDCCFSHFFLALFVFYVFYVKLQDKLYQNQNYFSTLSHEEIQSPLTTEGFLGSSMIKKMKLIAMLNATIASIAQFITQFFFEILSTVHPLFSGEKYQARHLLWHLESR